MPRFDLPQQGPLVVTAIGGIIAAGSKDASPFGSIFGSRHPSPNGIEEAALFGGAQFRHAAHQSLGVRVLGVVKDSLDRAAFHQLPGIHHAHVVTHAGDHTQVVGDVDDGCVKVALQVFDQVQHDRFDRHVQGSGRLIHDEERRVVEQGHGNHHPLLLAARDLMRVTLHHVGCIGHVYPVQHVNGFLPRFCFRDAPMDGQNLGQLIADGDRRVQGLHRILVDHRNLVTTQGAQFFLRAANQLPSLKLDAAADDLAVRPQKVHNAKGHRGLATARFAHNAERRGPVGLKRHLAHCLYVSITCFVRDGHVLDF